MKKFWDWVRNEAGERVLRLEGPIDEDDFWGDTVTPQMFRDELESEEGDVTVWINSPGGSCFAAAEIYTMLCEHKGRVTVKIDAIAASAASVVAMAGDRVLMSPVAMLMVHDPMTIAMGNQADLEKAISTLAEVKESIINAYARKTGLSRNKIAKLMSDETWMNAKKALELGFADEILYSKDAAPEATKAGEGSAEPDQEAKAVLSEWQPYSTRIMGQTILNRLGCDVEGKVRMTGEADEDRGEAENMEADDTGEQAEESTVAEQQVFQLEGSADEAAEQQPVQNDAQTEPDRDTGHQEKEAEINASLETTVTVGSAQNEQVVRIVISLDKSFPDGARVSMHVDPAQENMHMETTQTKAGSGPGEPGTGHPEKTGTGQVTEAQAGKATEAAENVTESSGDVAISEPDRMKAIGADGSPSAYDKPGMPVIGMDGHTNDGSMPYELLIKQLEFLK